MKVRIKSHSVRFRVDSEDLEMLAKSGVVREVSHIPDHSGELTQFTFEVRRGAADEQPGLHAGPYNFTLILSPADCSQLVSGEQDEIYMRREWTNDAGRSIRFLSSIEKDKKRSNANRSSGLRAHIPKADLI